MVATATPSRGCSFPRSARLLNSAAFDYVFDTPDRSSDRYFTVLTRSRRSPHGLSDSAGARLGLAISKRCAPGAVERNRIKRVIRESFRHHRPALPSVDLILLCRRGAAVAGNATLRRSLEAHWDRVRK